MRQADESAAHMHGEEGDRGDQKFPRVMGGTLVWDHQVGGCGFSGGGFDTRGCFLLRLPSSRFKGCCDLGADI